jgi:hypothetical protein
MGGPEQHGFFDPTAAGLDHYTSRLFTLESGNNPYNRTGSNRGLGQFGPQEERVFGINDQNWTDPQVQARAVAMEAQHNAPILAKALGRQPTESELYLAHQQGIGGAVGHLLHPDGLAWQTMALTGEGKQKGPGWARAAIWGNVPDQYKGQFGSVDNITSRAFTDMWAQRFGGGRAAPPASVPAQQPQPAPQGPTMSDAPLVGGPGQPTVMLTQQSQPSPVPPPGPQVAGNTHPPGTAVAPNGTPYPPPQYGQPGLRSPLTNEQIFPQPRDPAAFMRWWTNPNLSDAERQRVWEQFAPKTVEDINGNQWLHRPNMPPVLMKRSLGKETEIKQGETTVKGYVRQDPDGVLRTYIPQPYVSGGGGAAGAGGVGGDATGGTSGTPQLGTNPVHTGLGPFFDQQAEAEIERKAREDLVKKQNDALIADTKTKYDNTTQLASRAREELKENALALKLVNDPNFSAGPGSNLVAPLRNLAERITGKPYQSINDLYDKIRSQVTLAAISDFTNSGKVGPVRIPEMKLVDKMSPDRPEIMKQAIQAMLNIRDKLLRHSLAVQKEMIAWRGTHQGLLGDDWDQHLAEWSDRPENQLFTDDEINKYNDLFHSTLKSKDAGEGETRYDNGKPYVRKGNTWVPKTQ